MRPLLVLLAFLMFIPSVHGQDDPAPVPQMDRFQSALGKAVRSARQKGAISARQAIRLRVALIAPAFRQRAEDLAVTQMAFGQSGDDEPLPRSDDGTVNRAAIDWDNLLSFLEKLLPLLLQLLDAFATANLQFAGGLA